MRELSAVPASLFGIPVGLLGLAGAWHVGARIWALPPIVADAITGAGGIAWLILLALYAHKWYRHRAKAKQEARDPVQGVMNYFGAHVSRTARIEPVTPPGEVFVTEQFAARLALEPRGYACDYVGQVPAAKSYGTLRMYHLHARMR